MSTRTVESTHRRIPSMGWPAMTNPTVHAAEVHDIRQRLIVVNAKQLLSSLCPCYECTIYTALRSTLGQSRGS